MTIEAWQEMETELRLCLEVIGEAKRLGIPVPDLVRRSRGLLQQVITARGWVDSLPDSALDSILSAG